MTTEEYQKWEKEAIERGYKKYSTTSSSNDYSYFKTIGKKGDDYKYMIEWRVWDWRKYIDRDPRVKDSPYNLEVNIIPNSIKYDMRLDMLIGDPLVFGFDRIEEIAERYNQFVRAEIINHNITHHEQYPIKRQKTIIPGTLCNDSLRNKSADILSNDRIFERDKDCALFKRI